jgi:uncharacterized protein (DUF1778 family)
MPLISYGIFPYIRKGNIFMANQLTLPEKARFDAKIPKAQKEVFEYAARLGGFRTLTDFIINAVQEKANAIIQEHDIILASEKDREIFFNTLANPPGPNENLRDAAERYKLFIGENK